MTNRILLNCLKEFDRVKMNLDPYNWEIILTWDEKVNKYKNPIYSFKVRDKEIKIKTHTEVYRILKFQK
jgi:methylmalonyl-CoA mutase